MQELTLIKGFRDTSKNENVIDLDQSGLHEQMCKETGREEEGEKERQLGGYRRGTSP